MPLSKRNRSGIFWLILCALCIIYLPRIVNRFYSSEGIDVSYQKVQEIGEEIKSENDAAQEIIANKRPANKYSLPAEKFDPNTYSENDWMKLGVSQKQAEVIVNFAKRKLYSNEDLKRIYVLPDELFLLIKDSTFYPLKTTQSFSIDKDNVKKEVIDIDINTATSEELERIPGIGPYFAKKIIEHRTDLGGYIGKEQLLEIWKFDDEKLNNISPFIHVTIKNIRKLDINDVTFKELLAHPYIEYAVANSIVKMREQKRFQKIDDIKRSKLIDEELFNQLKPYILVQ